MSELTSTEMFIGLSPSKGRGSWTETQRVPPISSGRGPQGLSDAACTRTDTSSGEGAGSASSPIRKDEGGPGASSRTAFISLDLPNTDARREATRLFFLKFRSCSLAKVNRKRTARMERTTNRGIHRRRRITLQKDPLPFALSLRIRDGNCGHQGLCIRV